MWPVLELSDQFKTGWTDFQNYAVPYTYMQTALKMLDGNFPDEHVRKFAVNALHELPDDELEDILLQVTQVGGAYYHDNILH